MNPQIWPLKQYVCENKNIKHTLIRQENFSRKKFWREENLSGLGELNFSDAGKILNLTDSLIL